MLRRFFAACAIDTSGTAGFAQPADLAADGARESEYAGRTAEEVRLKLAGQGDGAQRGDLSGKSPWVR